MKYLFQIITLLFLILLFSCQSHESRLQPLKNLNSLYLDQQFLPTAPVEIETEQDIFKLDDEMIAMVENKLLSIQSTKKKARLLLEHIFSQDNIALSYASNVNVTARDAYHSKSANCMSLTIMAYALAKEAGLNANFQ